MLFKSKKNKSREVVVDTLENLSNVRIPITWDILLKEQKMKIANIVLSGETTSIPWGGQFECETIKDCYDIKTDYKGVIMYKFHTTDIDVSFREEMIIDRWLWFCKYNNKDYSKLKKSFEYDCVYKLK